MASEDNKVEEQKERDIGQFNLPESDESKSEEEISQPSDHAIEANQSENEGSTAQNIGQGAGDNGSVITQGHNDVSSPPPSPTEEVCPPVNSKISGYAFIVTSIILMLSLVVLIFLYIRNTFESAGNGSYETGLWVAFGVMLVANISLAYFAYISFKWRKILSESGTVSLVPEKWGAIIEQTVRATNTSTSIIHDLSGITSTSIQAHQEQYSELMDGLIKFQNAIDMRDKQIQKLEDGYDQSILKRHLNRLIRVHLFVEDIKKDEGETSRDVISISRLIEDALEECDITVQFPEQESDSRELGAMIEDPIIQVDSDDEEKNHLVCRVLSPAYVYDEGGAGTIVRPARVEVFQFRNSGEGVVE